MNMSAVATAAIAIMVTIPSWHGYPVPQDVRAADMFLGEMLYASDGRGMQLDLWHEISVCHKNDSPRICYGDTGSPECERWFLRYNWRRPCETHDIWDDSMVRWKA
jgi:hypothetical protein